GGPSRDRVVEAHRVTGDAVVGGAGDRREHAPGFHEETDAGLRGPGDLVARERALRVGCSERTGVERDDQDADIPRVDRVGVDGGVALVQDDAFKAVAGEGIATEGRRALGEVVDADVVGGDGVARHGGTGSGRVEQYPGRLGVGQRIRPAAGGVAFVDFVDIVDHAGPDDNLHVVHEHHLIHIHLVHHHDDVGHLV